MILFYVLNNDICLCLMLINCVYKFFDLMEVIKYYMDKMGRCISFEYGLFGGVND